MPLLDWISSDLAHSVQGLCFRTCLLRPDPEYLVGAICALLHRNNVKFLWFFVHFSLVSFLERLRALVQRLEFQSNEMPNSFASPSKSPSQRRLALEPGRRILIQSRTAAQKSKFSAQSHSSRTAPNAPEFCVYCHQCDVYPAWLSKIDRRCAPRVALLQPVPNVHWKMTHYMTHPTESYRSVNSLKTDKIGFCCL